MDEYEFPIQKVLAAKSNWRRAKFKEAAEYTYIQKLIRGNIEEANQNRDIDS